MNNQITVKDGYNLNLFEIQNALFSIEDRRAAKVFICPNAASNRILIRSDAFQYYKVEMVDISDTIAYDSMVSYEPELNLPLKLENGVHIVRASNENVFHFYRINLMKSLVSD